MKWQENDEFDPWRNDMFLKWRIYIYERYVIKNICQGFSLRKKSI